MKNRNLGSKEKRIRFWLWIFDSLEWKGEFGFGEEENPNPNFDFSLQFNWSQVKIGFLLLKFRLFTPRNLIFSAFYSKKSKSQVKIRYFCDQNLINSAFHSRNRKSWVEIRFFCSRPKLKFDLSLQNRSSNEWNIHFWWHKRRFFWLVYPNAHQSWSTPYGKVRHSGVSLATMLLFLTDPRSVLLKYYWRGLPYEDDIERLNDAGPYSETTSLVQLGTKRNFTVIWPVIK